MTEHRIALIIVLLHVMGGVLGFASVATGIRPRVFFGVVVPLWMIAVAIFMIFVMPHSGS